MIKRNPNRLIACYKARSVAKGFHQCPRVDFTETYNLVVKPQIVRLLLTIVVTNG